METMSNVKSSIQYGTPKFKELGAVQPATSQHQLILDRDLVLVGAFNPSETPKSQLG